MKIIIADDERYAQQYLKNMLEEIPRCHVVGEASNGVEVISKVLASQPDLVLMDIQMPVMNGIEAAKRLSKHFNSPQIIFTTAYKEYALEAFSTKACGYLLKPIIQSQLRERIAQAERNSTLFVRESLVSEESRQYVCCRYNGKIQVVPASEIIFFRAESKYTVVRHIRGRNLIEETLDKLEQDFSSQFLRIHRGTLVNIGYLKTFERDAENRAIVTLKRCKIKLPVSRRHYSEVRRYLMNHAVRKR